MMRNEQAKRQKGHRLLYMAVFFCFLALYAVTAQRGVSWQDSGEFQCRILAGDYQWHSGIARAHPLYIAIARGFVALFPDASCFYAMNLFSGLGLALALALLACNVMRLTRSTWAAVMAVSVLGFAHMAWWLGTIAEVYTWSLAFLMAEALCLIRYAENRDGRWLIFLFGVNGAHWGFHNVALLGLPVYLFLLVSAAGRGTKPVRVVCGCALAWLVGGSMMVWQAACLLLATGDPLLVLKSVLFGHGYQRQVLGISGFALRVWGVNMALAGVSLANPCWVFAVRGLWRREADGKKELLNWLGALTILHGVFWVRYFIADQATFVLPTLGLMAIWVGLGAGRGKLGVRSEELGVGETDAAIGNVSLHAHDQVSRKDAKTQRITLGAGWMCAVCVACAVLVPVVLNVAIQRSGMMVSRRRVVPFRDEVRYWLVPWKQEEVSAERFVTEVGKQLCQRDVLVADATTASPLLAAREAGRLSKGWRLVTPWSGEAEEDVLAWVRKGRVKVYVVSPVAGYAPKSLLESGCLFEPAGAVYRIMNKNHESRE